VIDKKNISKRSPEGYEWQDDAVVGIKKWKRAEKELDKHQFGFFAVNDKAATLLFIRYYAYLIANQRTIDEIGAISNSDEAIKLISNMNLQFSGSHMTEDHVKIRAYRETLFNTLASEYVVKMILAKQDCPSE